MPKLSHYLVATDPLDIGIEESVRVLLSTRSGKTVLLSDSNWQSLKNHNFENIVDSELALRLTSAEIIVPDDENELQTILDENKTSVENERILSFTLQPGADCQLGCGYCGQEHTRVFVSEEEQDKIIDRIRQAILAKSDKIDALSITWYGGEPLLAIKQLRRMSPLLQELARENGLSYLSDIVTNGISLIPQVVRELVNDMKVSRFQVTVDGPGIIHDQRRVTKLGAKTFDRIFGNIVRTCKSEVFQEAKCLLNLRCNVDAENAPYVDNLIDMVIDEGIQKYVYMSFAPVVDWGDVDNSSSSLSRPLFAKMEIDWLSRVHQAGFKTKLLPTRRKGVCMVVNPASEVIDAYGQVYSCWEMPYTETYADAVEDNLGFSTPPQYPTDSNALSNKDSLAYKLRNWFDEIPGSDYGCATCEYLPVCGGACPKSWVEGKPPCPSFKFNTREKLALTIMDSLKTPSQNLGKIAENV